MLRFRETHKQGNRRPDTAVLQNGVIIAKLAQSLPAEPFPGVNRSDCAGMSEELSFSLATLAFMAVTLTNKPICNCVHSL